MHLDNLKVDTNAPRRYNFAKKYCGRYRDATKKEKEISNSRMSPKNISN